MATSRSTRNRRVLIADDAEDVAQRLERLVGEIENLEVVAVAADGERALDLFHRSNPDVVLLDLQMPRKTGLEVLESIRSSGRPCAVILLTNHDDPETRARGLRAGADCFLSKATDLNRLPEVLRHLSTRG